MGVILLPQKHLAQPQYATQLNEAHLLNNAIEQAYFAGNRLSDLGVKKRNLGNTGASFSAHRAGLAFKTEGTTSSYFAAPTDALVRFSFESYYIPNAITVQYILGVQEAPNHATRDRELWIDGAGKFTFYIYDGAAKLAISTTSAALNTPVHIVATSDGSNIRLYINGVLEATTAAGNAYTGYTTPEFVIGSGQTSGSSSIPGAGWQNYAIVYNKALSAEEVKDRNLSKFSILAAQPRRIYVSSGSTSYTLTAASGSFSVTGTAATLKYGRALSADSGSFAVTGAAATLRKGYSLQAASGSFAATGTAATLRYGRVIQASGATFQVSGTAASLKYGRVLAAAPGAFQITGTDATLTYGTAGSYTLTAQSGSFSVSGTDATLRYGRKLSADSGSFAFTGTAATLRYARRVIAESGTFSITGTAATLTYSGAAGPITSTVERTAIFRAIVARSTKFQRSKSVTVRFN